MCNPWGTLTGIRPVKIVRTMLENGSSPRQVLHHFCDVYRTSREKAMLALQIAQLELQILNGVKCKDICLYIGVPFCKSRCLYCSFVTNSADKNRQYIAPYVANLKQEIAYTAALLQQTGFRVIGLYIGGGTPTTLSAQQLTDVIQTCFSNFDLSALREFTVEAGRPDTIDAEKLYALQQGGVTRISINPQSMHNKTLELIGRKHTAEEVVSSFSLARQLGFSDINMDLIAGLPGETTTEFRTSVQRVLALNPESVTVHTMSIKRGSRLHEQLGDYVLTDPVAVEQMVDYAREALMQQQYAPYYLYRQKHMVGNFENIGYAKAGAECLYNIMMMEETHSIVAMGTGGVTKIVRLPNDRIERIFNVKEAMEYVLRGEEMCHRKDIMLKWLAK